MRDSREKEQAHREDAAILRRYLAQQPALSRLALDAIPRFAERAGLDLKIEFEKIERFFANETANLILARILLIRFLEDSIPAGGGRGCRPWHRRLRGSAARG